MNLKVIFTTAFVLFAICFLNAQSVEAVIQKSLQTRGLNFSKDNFQITSEHTSKASDARHIYFRQLFIGTPIIGTESSIHLSSDRNMLFENIKFLDSEQFNKLRKPAPVIDPKEAVIRVAEQMGYVLQENLEVLPGEPTHFNEVWLSDGGISERNIKVKLIYTLTENNAYVLAWELDILESDYLHWWVFEVDAANGKILNKENSMRTCYTHDHAEEKLDYNRNLYNIENYDPGNTIDAVGCEECYEVIAFPLESPYFGDRTIVENPAHPIASPFGWHDTDGIPGPEYTETIGNNVDTFEGNFVFGYHPDGGSTLDFTGFDFDPEFSVVTPYIDASITNLFYWTNILHDITYQYGFDEVSGNFQENNYNRGGSGRDPVIAHGQSISRPCNASFNTQPDGENPLMIMNICNSKDGDFDSTVIAHEYGHGLIARLTGGAVINNCFRHAENPSEGWCDWLGIILTMKPEDVGATPRSIANYLTSQGANGDGIRPYPYSTDLNVNPLTYANVPTEIGIHAVGAIWGEILWEVSWALIDNYGFDTDVYNFTGDIGQDAGNIMALAIVIEALKITACQPGFVEARDAILIAAEEIYGAEVACMIWPAFAKRGLGFIADQGDANIKGDERVSFRIPSDGPIFEATYEPFCFYGGIYEGLGGGLPLGGVYSGVGVIDNGDGATFNYDPSVAGIGTNSVTYNFPATICSPAAKVTKEDIIVEDDTDPPLLECLADVSRRIEPNEMYFLADFTELIEVSDGCPGEIQASQFPPVGTEMELGPTEITITVQDTAGNVSSCSFQFLLFLSPVDNDGQITDILTFYPNPANNEITLINTTEKIIEGIQIRDMQGRLVQEYMVNSSLSTSVYSLGTISSGVYFVSILLPNDRLVLRLVKR